MVTTRTWLRYFSRKLTESLALFVIRFCFTGAFMLGAAIASAGLIIVGFRIVNGDYPESPASIVGWSVVIGLSLIALLCAFGALATFWTHRLLVGEVVWIEEGADIDGPREWVSRVRLSCHPGLEIITPVAFPFHGTRTRMMIVWVPRGPLPTTGEVTAEAADLV